MRRATLATAVYLALLFLSGVAVGWFALRLYSGSASVIPRSPEEYRRRYVAELRERLKLTEQQVNQLGPILDETRQRHHEMMKTIHDAQVSKIRSILTESQQVEYTKLLEERERERQRQQQGH